MKNCQICGAEFEPAKYGVQKYCATCRPIAKRKSNKASYYRQRNGLPTAQPISDNSILKCWMHWLLKLAGHRLTHGTVNDERAEYYKRMAAMTYTQEQNKLDKLKK